MGSKEQPKYHRIWNLLQQKLCTFFYTILTLCKQRKAMEELFPEWSRFQIASYLRFKNISAHHFSCCSNEFWGQFMYEFMEFLKKF